uniref:Aquaporin n=1 Tax=Steinernema glaseri TaxID=37863 RepID=A0A1I7XZ52_9BILA
MQAHVARLRFGSKRLSSDSPTSSRDSPVNGEEAAGASVDGFGRSVLALDPKSSNVVEFIHIPFVEFLASLLFTFLSNLLGVANETPLLSISIFEGLLIYMLSIIFGSRSGAHMNPALTLSCFMMGQCRLILGIAMVFMQCFGAFFGALLTRAVLSASSFTDVLHIARILRNERKGSLTDDLLFLESSSAEVGKIADNSHLDQRQDFFLESVLTSIYIVAYIVPMSSSTDGFATASSTAIAKAATTFIGYRTLGQSTNIARTLANNVMISIFALDDSNWALFYLFLLASVLASFASVLVARLITIMDHPRRCD